ncbi:MAG: class I SAM-dependent methyltransferase [bacterium]
MEPRKQKEQEHANKLKTLLKEAQDKEKVASNKKFYSITRSNRDCVEKRVAEGITDGKKVLDYCCGAGEISISLSKLGADVIGVDISDVSVKNAKENAVKAGLKGKLLFLIMDGENLEFEKDTFDTIICSGVLHHLDINKAYAELARVLKPNGEVICNEPLAYNPLFQLYRKLTPGLRTKWEAEHILSKESIDSSKKYFNKMEMRFYHLTTILAVPFRHTPYFNRILSIFEAIDSALLKLPLLKWMAWQIIFIVSEPKGKIKLKEEDHD